MSRIRSRGNEATELALAKLFQRNKITGWRRNQKVFGKPDFVFYKIKLAIFVDGCFWHGCPKHGTQPGRQPFVLEKEIRPEQSPRPAGEPRLAADQLAGVSDLGA